MGDDLSMFNYIIHPHNWKAEEILHFQNLFDQNVQHDKRDGHALIEAAYKAADDKGSPTVYWLTQEFNQTARRLYHSIATITPFTKYSR